MDRVIVVGAGAAGVAAAETLRRRGHMGPLVLVGAEPGLPYDRPPLSKQVLAGTWQMDRVALRTDSHYEELEIDRRPGRRARALDTGGHSLQLDCGERLDFDGLIIATGVTARRLPFGHDLTGVHVLRTAQDALALKAHLDDAPRVVIVGAGLIGMEVAAVTRSLGLDATVVDPLPTPMVRQIGPLLGTMLARVHSDHGVALRLGVGVTGLTDDGHGHVSGVTLGDGSVEKADCVLVAIGAAPEVGWLDGSGLDLSDGIRCDRYCRAAPGVYAAGDVASWPSARYGRRLRLEHRMNATEQAGAAAANLLSGDTEPFDPVPYFWSDQYDIKIQAHGIFPSGAEVVAAEGSLTGDRFVALFREGATTVGVLGWNMPKQTRQLRQQLLEASATPLGGTL
ncbi:FAD/NAD(P)-binding oxidoreductase [Streptomyces sp. NPDC051985]|uniref:NAD(P)/FAD-dependent oxidoreductase n=1 Tax=Streptomyces sp. NPDC051985 TaxID=3155807 RepID=UPI003445180F